MHFLHCVLFRGTRLKHPVREVFVFPGALLPSGLRYAQKPPAKSGGHLSWKEKDRLHSLQRDTQTERRETLSGYWTYTKSIISTAAHTLIVKKNLTLRADSQGGQWWFCGLTVGLEKRYFSSSWEATNPGSNLVKTRFLELC